MKSTSMLLDATLTLLDPTPENAPPEAVTVMSPAPATLIDQPPAALVVVFCPPTLTVTPARPSFKS